MPTQQELSNIIQALGTMMTGINKGVQGARTQPMMQGQQIGQTQQFAPPPNVMSLPPLPPPTMTSGGGGGAPQTQPLKLNYDTSGAGARMPQPTPRPGPAPFTPSPYGNQMMEKLSPNAAGVYSGIQGISQVLSQWNQKKEQKKQVEASNTMTNLADAVTKGDVARQYEIMGDPKAMTLLEKVFPGAFTKAKDAPKPPDSETQAAMQALQKYFQGGQQPQQPTQIGGRMVPQPGTLDRLAAGQANINEQAMKQQPARALDTQMSPDQQLNAQLAKAGLITAPADAAAMDVQAKTSMYNTYIKSLTEAAKQNEITKRVMAVSKDHNYTLTNIGKAHDDAKIRATRIIADSKDYATDKKDASKDPTLGMLKWQLDNFTKLRDTAGTNYEKAVANGNKDASAIFKDSMDKYDAEIKGINTQIKGQTQDSYVSKIMNWAATGAEGEPPDDESTDTEPEK